MTLGDVLAGVKLRKELAPALKKKQITSVEYDSRLVGKGAVFFAFAGARVDGRRFAQEALDRGATAVVSELTPPEGFTGAWLQVEHGRQALATASRNFYRHPDERIGMVISGTLLVGYGEQFDESKMKALSPGSIWTEPANQPHFVWAKDGEVVIQITGNGPSGTTVVQPK